MTNKLNKTIKYIYFLLIISIFCTLIGCTSMFNQLKNVGKPPQINKVNIYDKENLDQYYPKSTQNQEESSSSNSLWTPNSKTFFFRERKAKDVGDILKIKIVIEDKAKLNNKTTKKKKSDKDMGLPNFFGLEKTIENKIPATPGNLIGLNSKSDSSGDGEIDRKRNNQNQHSCNYN